MREELVGILGFVKDHLGLLEHMGLVLVALRYKLPLTVNLPKLSDGLLQCVQVQAQRIVFGHCDCGS